MQIKIDLFYHLNNREKVYIGSTNRHKTVKSAIKTTMSYNQIPTYKNRFFYEYNEEMIFEEKRFSGVIDKKFKTF